MTYDWDYEGKRTRRQSSGLEICVNHITNEGTVEIVKDGTTVGSSKLPLAITGTPGGDLCPLTSKDFT